MQRLFSMFPAGAAGTALLLLRASVAAALIVDGVATNTLVSSSWAPLCVLVAVVFLLLGFLTPYAGVVSCLFFLGLLLITGWQHGLHLIFSAVDCAVLALLGPGAYSIDARVFGRRILTFPPVSRRGR